MVKDRFPDFQFVLFFGSQAAGNGAADADFDLIIIVDRIRSAYREILCHRGNLFDIIVADVPAISHLILSGKRANDLSISRNVYHSRCLPSLHVDAIRIKTLAKAQLNAGARVPHPPNARLTLTILINALRNEAAEDARIVIGLDLLKNIETIILLHNGIGFTDGKYSAKALRHRAPHFVGQYIEAAKALCGSANTVPLLLLAEQVLDKLGGPLLVGFRYDYPPLRRSPNPAPQPR